MFSHSLRNLLALVSALFFMSVSAAVMAAETYPGSDPDQAPTIILDEEAPSKRTITLQEQWRIGGEDEEDVLMGMIVDGLVDSRGFTYLLDMQLSQVLVISPDGQLENTLGREGDGPGEMRRPVGLVLFDDGIIGVAQSFPGKVITLNEAGDPGPAFSVGNGSEGGFAYLMFLKHVGEHTIAGKGTGTFDSATQQVTNTMGLISVDNSGNDLVRFSEITSEQSMMKQVFDEAESFTITQQRFALAPGGVLFTAPRQNSYEIHVRGMDGVSRQVLKREFPLRKRTREDKEEMKGSSGLSVAGTTMEIERHFLDTDPPITSLAADSQGNLYVQNCYFRPGEIEEGTMARYDVISPEGTLVEELTIRCEEGLAKRDRLIFLDGNNFLLLKHANAASRAFMAGFGLGNSGDDEEEEAEPLEVILYSMPQ